MAALLGVAVFKGVDIAELDRIETGSRVVEPADDARIFADGDAGDAVYAIVGGTGYVRIGAVDRNNKGLMIEVFGVGEIFGEIAVIDNSTRTADAVADGRVQLLRINGSVFLDALRNSPVLGFNLCRMLATRLRRTSILFRGATFESLEVRLARQVLYLAKHEGRNTEQGLRLAGRFRQSDLADLLGATNRSIITILNSWRMNGLVIYEPARGQLTICREAELQQLANSPLG